MTISRMMMAPNVLPFYHTLLPPPLQHREGSGHSTILQDVKEKIPVICNYAVSQIGKGKVGTSILQRYKQAAY